MPRLSKKTGRKAKKICIRVTEMDFDTLNAMADSRGEPITTFVQDLVRKWLREDPESENILKSYRKPAGVGRSILNNRGKNI